jgi:hypothetical protein
MPTPKPTGLKVDPIKTPDKINLETNATNPQLQINQNSNFNSIERDGVRIIKEPVAPRTINGMTEHLPLRASERGFSPENIIKIVDEGNMTEAVGRYGNQIHYTLGHNTVVVDEYSTIITVFSNARAMNGLPKGFFIPFK